MRNKKISILVSIALVTSIFASGCGSSKDSKTTSNLSNMNASGLPIVKDKVNYTINARTYAVTNSQYNELEFFKNMEKDTNIHINWNNVPVDSWNEKKNLIFAGNDLPDAFYGPWVLNDNEVWKYGAQKMLIPLDAIIDKYCPNIKKLLDTYPEYKKALVAPDGHIYALPSIDELQLQIADTIFINKKWLDTLKLKVPTTTEEFKNVLMEFRDKDPNGNGKKDEVPFNFIFNNGPNGNQNMFGSFGLPDTVDNIIVKNDKVIYTAVQAEYKEGIKYFNSLAKENLIDKEAFTHNVSTYNSKIKSKNVGAFVGWGLNSFFGTTEVEYIAIEPLKGPKGDQMWSKKDYVSLASKGAFAITSKCENPEILMRWIDQSYEPEMSLQASLGLFGSNLEKQSNGKILKLPIPQGKTSSEFRHQQVPGVSGVGAISKEISEKIIPDSAYQEKLDYVKMYEKFVPKNLKQMPSLFYSEEQLDKINSINTDVLSFANSQYAKWVLSGDIDSEWDAYVKKLNDMGLQDLMKIYQTSYDKFLSQK